MTLTLLFSAVAGSAAIGYLFWQHARRGTVAGRPSLNDEDLIKQFAAAVPPRTILNVLKLVGECYGIPYAKIRPEDCLIQDYSKADSWRFDQGAERLDEALRTGFNIVVPGNLKSMKIRELVLLVANAPKC
jgi:hypothetical protein